MMNGQFDSRPAAEGAAVKDNILMRIMKAARDCLPDFFRDGMNQRL